MPRPKKVNKEEVSSSSIDAAVPPPKVCLKWNNHNIHFLSVLGSFQQNDVLVDVTIACEGQNIKAHKIVLSACSPYFRNILLENPCPHPVVIIFGIKYEDIKTLLDFMYKGQVIIPQNKIESFLQAAEALKVKGLSDELNISNSNSEEANKTEQNPAHTDTTLQAAESSNQMYGEQKNESPKKTMLPRRKRTNRKRSLPQKTESPQRRNLRSQKRTLSDSNKNEETDRKHQRKQSFDNQDVSAGTSIEALEQTLTKDDVSMNNSDSLCNIRIESIIGNATIVNSPNIQEPESPPDIKPIIDYGESIGGLAQENLMLYCEHPQPELSGVHGGSLLQDNSQDQDIKPIIDHGDSSGAIGDGNLMLISEHLQPGPSGVQDGSLLHDNSHDQGMKSTIDCGESSGSIADKNLMLIGEHPQPEPSSEQDGSFLQDNYHAQGIISLEMMVDNRILVM